MRSGYRIRRFFAARQKKAYPAPKLQRRAGLLVLVLVCAIAFLFTMFWIDSHLRPVVTQLATARVHYLATKAINDAVDEKINTGKLNYDSIIHFEKDVNGQITALKTDIATVNRLRTELVSSVLENIETIGSSDLAVPLGNVLSADMFSGRGPSIPVRIVPVGAASANFENVFSASGINQTRHQILLKISVEISVLLPGYSASAEVCVDISLAETIIVGTVPDQYTNLDESIFRN